MENSEIKIIAIGAHPDDVELGCGGFLAKAKAEGFTTGIIILTNGDACRSGDAETRTKEATKAAKTLKADYFKMLGFEDGRLISDIKTNELVARELAQLRPSIVITHYEEEIHPDHIAAYNIVNKAIFLSQLKRFSPEVYSGPKQTLYYWLNPKKIINPDLLIDITDVFEIKKKALAAHKSQSSVIKSLDTLGTVYGSLCETQYAEGFMLECPLKVTDINSLL